MKNEVIEEKLVADRIQSEVVGDTKGYELVGVAEMSGAAIHVRTSLVSSGVVPSSSRTFCVITLLLQRTLMQNLQHSKDSIKWRAHLMSKVFRIRVSLFPSIYEPSPWKSKTVHLLVDSL